MILQLLNIIGIFLTMPGLFLIYKYGISPMFKKGPGVYFHSQEYLMKKTKELKHKEADYKRMADIGLWLSLIGIFIQAIIQFTVLFI